MTEPSEGDTVCVKLRSEPGSERVVHKFEGEVTEAEEERGIGDTKTYRIRLPFGVMNNVSVKEYKAEFEILDNE